MSNRTVQNSQLKPNTDFYVRGELGYSRITSQIAGEELRKSDERRSAKGWLPVNKPYTTATINNAQVLMQNPQAPTPEEIFAQESLYTSKKGKGYSFNANNKGKFLPWVGQRNPDGSVTQITPEGELDNGLKVTLCMRIFAVRNRPNRGVTLDGIIVEEPIRYYSNNQAGAMLKKSGIVFHTNPEAEAARRVDGNNAHAPTGENGADEFSNMAEPIQAQPALQNSYSTPAQNVAQPQPNIPAPQPMTPQTNPFTNPGAEGGMHFNPDGNNGIVNTGNRNY